MESYNNTGIKDIITEFPEVGAILEEYGIGCGPCTVGICLLKDILDIHKMAPEKEQALMARIEDVIYQGRRGREYAPVMTVQDDEAPHVFSPPMQLLVDEHTLIKRFVAVIPSLAETVELGSADGRELVTGAIDLIQTFADRKHHTKEEDILFTYFDTSEKIFQVICEDHRTARGYVKEMLAALESEDVSLLSNRLVACAELLAEHIKKEDEILFPWLDRKLTESQKAELAVRFEQEDGRDGIDPHEYESFLNRLEARFGQ